MTTFETRIAEALAAHERKGGIRDMKIHCACGWSEPVARMRSSKAAHLAHQAAMLAPLIRDAQAVALEDAAVELAEDKYECYDQYYARWLDSRAAEIRQP